MKVIFKTSLATLEGNFNASQTSQQIYEKLPIESKVNTWGEEIYFPIPLTCKPENPTLKVELGDIAYWPEGKCLCIFFGRTPISTDEQPKPASEVNLVGKIIGDISILKKIKSDEKISVFKQ